MDERAARAGCLLLGLLLVALVFYQPAFFGLAHDWHSYETRVTPDTTEEYGERVSSLEREGRDREELRVRAYEELSPEAQSLFDRTLEAPTDEEGTHSYRFDVCDPGTVACPWRSQSDLPAELTWNQRAPERDAALIVEADDRRHLFSTPATASGHPDYFFGPGVEYYFRALFLLPGAAYLLAVVVPGRVDPRLLPGEDDPINLPDGAGALGVAVASLSLGFWIGSTWGNPLWVPVFGLVPALWGAACAALPATRPGRAELALGCCLAGLALLPVYLHAYGVAPSAGRFPPLAALTVSWFLVPLLGIRGGLGSSEESPEAAA